MHNSSTLQGRANLEPFRFLTTLELKKTPLHMVEGISKLRARLGTIICVRCLTYPQVRVIEYTDSDNICAIRPDASDVILEVCLDMYEDVL